MNRFFVPGAKLTMGNTIDITDAQDVQHIQRVLRLKGGDALELADGAGLEAVGQITELAKTIVRVKVVEESTVNRESPLEIVLYQGLPKGQKLEVIFQKNTEIGVAGFVPMITERCVVKINDMDAENKKRVRWQMIIDEAAKQSKRGRLPVLKPAVSLNEALGTLTGFDLILVPHTGEGTCPLAEVLSRSGLRRIAVFIGPEGGFTESEVRSIVEAGGKAITLGPRILRTETAGFVASSIL
ncbi:16S rRNA (uracil(1498)-N(3))-methyltransferase, partial [bacterium]